MLKENKYRANVEFKIRFETKSHATISNGTVT